MSTALLGFASGPWAPQPASPVLVTDLLLAFAAPLLAIPFLIGLSVAVRNFSTRFWLWLIALLATYFASAGFTAIALAAAKGTINAGTFYIFAMGAGMLLGLGIARITLRGRLAPNYSLKRTAADGLR